MVFLHVQGPVVQSIVSLASLLVVKMLTDLVSTISNSFLLKKKNVSSLSIQHRLVSFCCLHIVNAGFLSLCFKCCSISFI